MRWAALGGGGSPHWRPRGEACATRRGRSDHARPEKPRAGKNDGDSSARLSRGATRWPNSAVIASVAVGAAAGVAAGISLANGTFETRGFARVFASLSGSVATGPAVTNTAVAPDAADTAPPPQSLGASQIVEEGTRGGAVSAVDADAHAAAVNDWHERWRDGRIGFHLPATHRALMKHKNSLLGEGVTSPPELSKRVFVPLCGKAVDMLWLAACGHRVYGVDLSGVAARDFFDRAGLPRTTTPADAMVTERWSAGIKRVHTSGNIAIVEGDLFSIRPDPDPRPDEDDVRRGWFGGVIPRGDGDALGGSIIARSSSAVANEDAADSSSALDARVGAQGSISFREEALRFASGGGPAMDAVWDRGALVAVEPSLRDRYASALATRLAPGGRMLVVSVSYDPNAGCAGPPHNVPHEEIVRLYESRGCEVTLLGSEEVIETAPPRMREKISSMTESAYLVRKPHRRGKGGFHLPRPRL